MKISLRRPALVAAFAAAAVVVGGATAAPTWAQPVTSGSISFSGDPGDYITGGLSYSYSVDAGDILNVSSDEENNHVGLSVTGFNGDWWFLELDAPTGQSLTPGTYDGATRYPFNGAGPGLSLFGNGRGCNTLTGSFTVQNAVYGPHGYVQTFDATFEQHCEGGVDAARGEVHISNPPPPPELALDLTVTVDGTASTVTGNAIVHGTVSCNKPVDLNLAGNVTEIVKKVVVRGSFAMGIDCTPGAPTAWTATAVPSGTTPFTKGTAQVDAQVTGFDPDYGVNVSDTATQIVSLRKG